MNDAKKRMLAAPDWAFLALGAVLFLFSNGRWAVAPLAWVAPVPILAFLRGRKKSWSALTLMPFFIVWGWVMLRGIIPAWMGPVSLGLTAYFGILWWLPYFIDSLLFRRLPAALRLWVFPAALTAGEYLSALVFGDWGSVAFSQAENLPLLQIVSLAGIWGITFLMGCFASLAAFLVRGGWKERSFLRAGFGFLVAWIAVMTYGGLRLGLVGGGPTVRVGSFAAHEGERGIAGLSELIAGSRQAAQAGARIVFWPEALIDVNAAEAAAIEKEAGRLAAELGIHFMPAFHRRPEGGMAGSQRALMFGPAGEKHWDYNKSHPVPGSTDARGDGRVPMVRTPFGWLGAAICYDFDFPHFIRQAGQMNVDIMLAPSWDWREIDPLHSRMAVFRAVENGFSLVRYTMSGLSIAVDPLGRTRAALDHYQTRDRLFIADVPARGLRTFYAWAGDWLPWACLLFLSFCFFLSWRRDPRPGIVPARNSPN